MVRFAAEQLIVHRNVRHACVGWVRPVRVVSDNEHGRQLCLAAETIIGFEEAVDGGGCAMTPVASQVGT
jgi:hypothetical protein